MSFLTFKDTENNTIHVNKEYIVCIENNHYNSFPTDYRIYVALSKKSYAVDRETYEEIKKTLKIND